MQASERRRSQRMAIDSAVCLWHPTIEQFVNGRGVDISRHGAAVDLPVSVPVSAGQLVDINFVAPKDRTEKPTRSARVVRVSRDRVLEGVQRLGLEFS